MPLPPPEPPPAGTPVEISADGENEFDAGIATAEENVVVKNQGDTVYCDRLVYNAETKTAICKGNVRIYTKTQIYRGDTIIYNFETKIMQSADFRYGEFPSYVAGDRVMSPGLNHYRVHNGYFTTDNRSNPAFKLRANTIEIYPNHEIVMKNVTAYVEGIPVFWFPIYEQSLKHNQEGYKWALGYSDRFGFFYDNRYIFLLDDHLLGTALLDYRDKRGIGGGFNLDYAKDNANKAIFRGYVTQDELYSSSADPSDITKYRYPGVDTTTRYRIGFKERFDLGSDVNITSSYSKWSDPYVTQDFFEDEYRQEVQPNNFVEAVQTNPNYTISALVRPQVNPFFETVERKPEIDLDNKEQKIFDSPVSYENDSSLVDFDRRFAYGSTTPDYSAYRYDTFHQFLYPGQYFNFLSVTPRLGLRGTYYSDDNREINEVNSDGYPERHPRARFVPNVGLESSFKVSKAWTDIEDKSWGIYGLRHVAEPYLNTQYIPVIVGARPDDILGFDDRLPSTRLQPLNFPSYNSIDSIDYQAVVREGIRNKLQTKRDGKNWDLISWDLYGDYDIDRNFSVTDGQPYSNLFSDVLIQPVNWIYFRSESSLDIMGHSYNEINNDVTWQPTRSFRASVGNRYINNSVLFPNSDLYYVNLFYRLNEHYQFETTSSFEASTGQLQEQDYTVYRDLSEWQVAFTFRDRLINPGVYDEGFYISFTLKAFPGANITTSSLNP